LGKRVRNIKHPKLLIPNRLPEGRDQLQLLYLAILFLFLDIHHTYEHKYSKETGSVIPLWFGYDLISGVAAGVVVGFGLAGFLVTPAIVGGKIIDEDADKTGLRREGIYTSVSGFITRSSGLISALAFFIVGMIFYRKNLEGSFQREILQSVCGSRLRPVSIPYRLPIWLSTWLITIPDCLTRLYCASISRRTALVFAPCSNSFTVLY